MLKLCFLMLLCSSLWNWNVNYICSCKIVKQWWHIFSFPCCPLCPTCHFHASDVTQWHSNVMLLNPWIPKPCVHVCSGKLLPEHRLHHALRRDRNSHLRLHSRRRNLFPGPGEHWTSRLLKFSNLCLGLFSNGPKPVYREHCMLVFIVHLSSFREY